MIEVIVVGEGQTEETFIREVLGPHAARLDISIQPRLVPTSADSRGGALSPDRVLRYLRRTLLERSDTYVTTFVDLYGLSRGFPGVSGALQTKDPIERCRIIERELSRAVLDVSGRRRDRFFAHVQPYEFEALLFADLSAFHRVHPTWRRFAKKLQQARDVAETPEEINDGPTTHPSAVLKVLREPRYKKQLHGSRIAQAIGLPRIRSECRHFDEWLARIESLGPIRG